ncbi:Oligosaccharyltransferase subunit Ribophorin II-domain-containing protein [Sporodiniella umbellata]|nr:Oligosaccharyltransferase subunit Ribophorin II-domain-containing protein [Sporodiniella umbellata]
MNNNSSSIFTWALEAPKHPATKTPKDTLLINDTSGLEDEIFQFLLESPEPSLEAKLNHSSSSDSFSSGEEGNSRLSPKESQLNYTTGRLDFRHKYDNLSDTQLKAMTSKERRQLRNKISARNFRNRRKEYVGTLEAELDEQKAENNRLKLELSWLQTEVNTLTSENEQLKLELSLGSIVQPTLKDADWELAFPEQAMAPEPDVFYRPTTFISQAVVPSWDAVFLRKETQAPDSHPLMQQYPLLAPALMSIVLNHTMSMSTDQLLASAQLSPAKETKDVLELLSPLATVKENTAHTKTLLLTKEKQKEEPGAYFCPIAWLSTTLCQHIGQMICRSIPPATPIENQTFLCRSYLKAVRYITAESGEEDVFTVQPEIHHVFRAEEKMPPTYFSTTFSVIVLLPWVLLALGWTQLGYTPTKVLCNLTSLPMVSFLGSLIAIEYLFYLYWTHLSLFQMLPYLGGLCLAAFITGQRALTQVQERR